MLQLKDLVFGAREIDDDLMINQDISYIMIKQQGYLYTIIRRHR